MANTDSTGQETMGNIIKSLLIIVAAVAVVGTGTHSYFSKNQVLGADDNKDMSYKTATVDVGNVIGFPMSFDNMVPGGEYTKDASIKYTGTTNGDLYFGATLVTGYADLSPILQVAIEKYNVTTAKYEWITSWMQPANLYTSWTKLAINVSPNETTYYRIHVKVDSSAGNQYQNMNAYNGVVIHAVQAGIPAEGTPNQLKD